MADALTLASGIQLDGATQFIGIPCPVQRPPTTFELDIHADRAEVVERYHNGTYVRAKPIAYWFHHEPEDPADHSYELRNVTARVVRSTGFNSFLFWTPIDGRDPSSFRARLVDQEIDVEAQPHVSFDSGKDDTVFRYDLLNPTRSGFEERRTTYRADSPTLVVARPNATETLEAQGDFWIRAFDIDFELRTGSGAPRLVQSGVTFAPSVDTAVASEGEVQFRTVFLTLYGAKAVLRTHDRSYQWNMASAVSAGDFGVGSRRAGGVLDVNGDSESLNGRPFHLTLSDAELQLEPRAILSPTGMNVVVAALLEGQLAGGSIGGQELSSPIPESHAGAWGAWWLGSGVVSVGALSGIFAWRRRARDPGRLLRAAEASLVNERYTKAARLSQSVLRLRPGSIHGVLILATAWIRSGSAERALRFLAEQRFSRKKDRAAITFVTGVGLVQMGQVDEGYALIEAAIRHDPTLHRHAAAKTPRTRPSPGARAAWDIETGGMYA